LPWAVCMQVWGLVPLVLSCWLDRLWSLPSLFFVVFAFLVVRLVSGPWRCDERLLWHLFALGPSCLGQCVCRCGPFVRGQTQSQALCRFHMGRRKWPFMLNWGCGDYITSVQWVQGGSEVNQSPGITTPWSDSTQNSHLLAILRTSAVYSALRPSFISANQIRWPPNFVSVLSDHI
jgi:hypothetical protein